MIHFASLLSRTKSFYNLFLIPDGMSQMFRFLSDRFCNYKILKIIITERLVKLTKIETCKAQVHTLFISKRGLYLPISQS